MAIAGPKAPRISAAGCQASYRPVVRMSPVYDHDAAALGYVYNV
jgi:hypothetical protein